MKIEIDAKNFIEKITYVEQWLDGHNLKHRNTRFSHAKSVLTKGVSAGEVNEEEMVPFQWANQELDEYIYLFEILQNVKHERFLGTLAKSLNGPNLNKNEEKGASASGRNFMFELITAAKFSDLGFKVDFDGDADSVIRIGNNNIFVECKKPLGKNISNLIKAASKQIRKRCNQSNDSYGIVALDITRVISQESHLNGPIIGDSDYIQRIFYEIASKFDFSFLEKDFPEVLGVVTRFSLPFWTSDDVHLTTLRRFDFFPLKPDSHEVLQKFREAWV